jgi:hypothetical protein
MTTGDKFVNLCEKRLLGLTSLKDYFLDFMRLQFQELVSKTWDLDGTLGASKVAISGSGNDEFNLDTGKTGTDGVGHFLVTAAAYETNVQFQNANAIDYDVALHYAERPMGININPRTAQPEYDSWEEAIGVRADPNSVTEVSGTVRAVVDSVFEASVSNAGRKCLIFMKVPAEGATTEVIGVEECTVQWDSSNNYIVTSGALGQSTISTTASDYSVIALGPAVRRNTDLEAASGYWYIGEVTGAGAGNPPTVFDITDQRLIEKSLSTLLENLVYADADNVFTGENTFENDTTFESDTYLEGDNNVTGELKLGPTSHAEFESPTDWYYQRLYFNVDFVTDFPSSKLLWTKLGDNASGTPNIRFYASRKGLVITLGAYWNSSNYWYYDPGISTAYALRLEENSLKYQFYDSSSPWTDTGWRDMLLSDIDGVLVNRSAVTGLAWARNLLDSDHAGSYTGAFYAAFHGGSGQFARKNFVIAGSLGEIETSSAGLVWTKRTQAGSYSGYFRGGCYSPTLDQFLLVGSGGEIQTSDGDVYSWTARTPAGSYSGDFHAACWSEAEGLYVIVGTGGEIQTSPDGINWTHRNAAGGFSGDFNCALYSEDEEVFVIAGASGEIESSQDGITWTKRTAPGGYSGTYISITTDERIIVLVSSSRIHTSYNGTSWSERATKNSMKFVVYGNGLFLIPAWVATFGNAYWWASRNGEDWTQFDLTLDDSDFLAGAYGHERFVFAGDTSYNPCIQATHRHG